MDFELKTKFDTNSMYKMQLDKDAFAINEV